MLYQSPAVVRKMTLPEIRACVGEHYERENRQAEQIHQLSEMIAVALGMKKVTG